MYLFFQSLTDFRANGHNAIQSACFTFLSFISTQPTPIHEPLIPRRASSPNRRILRLQNNCMPKICTYLRMVVPRCNTYSSGLSAHFRPQWAYSRRGERSLDRRPTHFHTHRRLVLRLTSELPSLDLPAYTLTQQFLTVSFHSVTFPSLLRSSLSSRLPPEGILLPARDAFTLLPHHRGRLLRVSSHTKDSTFHHSRPLGPFDIHIDLHDESNNLYHKSHHSTPILPL